MNRIAREVGITKPAIYHYFRNKKELFREVLTFFFDEMGRWSSERFGGCTNLQDLLKALFESLTAFRDAAEILVGMEGENTDYSFTELLLSAARRDRRIGKRVERAFMFTRDKLKLELIKARENGEIRDDIDCDALAFQIHALIEGTGLISFFDSSVRLEAMGMTMSDNIWKMLKK
jgi:AcrR family transcriptional regulator